MPVVNRLRQAAIGVWIDTDELTPGVAWQDAIREAINTAFGLIVFVSQASRQSKWVLREITLAEKRGGLIIPVLLDPLPFSDLPIEVQTRQFVNLSAPEKWERGVQTLIQSINHYLKTQTNRGTGLKESEINAIAVETRNQARRTTSNDESRPPQSVFIVHGHNVDLRDVVERYLFEVGVEPVVLGKMDNKHKTLFQKFLAWSEETRVPLF